MQLQCNGSFNIFANCHFSWIILSPSHNLIKIITINITKRSVMITQEICPIRAEISTHKNFGKCIYLLFV